MHEDDDEEPLSRSLMGVRSHFASSWNAPRHSSQGKTPDSLLSSTYLTLPARVKIRSLTTRARRRPTRSRIASETLSAWVLQGSVPFPNWALLMRFCTHTITTGITGTTRESCGLYAGLCRLMTALTLAYAHALQSNCLDRRAGGLSVHNFRYRARQANCCQLPLVPTTARLTGVDFRGWSIFTDGGTHANDLEATAG